MEVCVHLHGSDLTLDAEMNDEIFRFAAFERDRVSAQATGAESDSESMELFRPLLVRLFGEEGCEQLITAADGDSWAVGRVWTRMATECCLHRMDYLLAKVGEYSDGITAA